MARRRKPGVRRSRATGRVSRPPGPRENAADATLATRARHTGLTPTRALDALAGSVAGLLRLCNDLSTDQYDTCQWYGGVIRRHAVVMGYPASMLHELGIDAGIGAGLVAEDADEARRAKQTYHAACRVLAGLPGRTIASVGDLALDRLSLNTARNNITEIRLGLDSLLHWRRNQRK